MENAFRIRFPFESPTNTLTPFNAVKEQRYIAALEAKDLFPRRLRIIQDFQNVLGSRDIIESLKIKGSAITESQSTKPYLTKTTSYPNHVIYDYEVLPICSEITTCITKSVLNVSTGKIMEQDMIVGIRIEKPLKFLNQGQVEIITGILNIPSSQITDVVMQKQRFDEKLMNDLRQRYLYFLKQLITQT